MQKWRQWESAPDSDWGTALEREAVIRPLAEERKLGRAAVQEASQHLGVSRALVYRLIARYRQRAKTSSLLPWKRGPARNTRCLRRIARRPPHSLHQGVLPGTGASFAGSLVPRSQTA